MVLPRPVAEDQRRLPEGVTVEPSGFGTLLTAPSSAYEPPPPPDPVAVPERAPPGMRDVAPEIAHLIRVLPRLRPQPERTVLTTLEAAPIITTTTVLRDGCFRLAMQGEPLVLLPPGFRAFVDPQGYLALGAFHSPASLSGRVGEPIQWEGRMREVREAAVVARINRACGAGRVVQVGLFRSAAAQANVEDAVTTRSVSERYGTPYGDARRKVAACRAEVDRKRAELRRRYGDRTPPVGLLPGSCTLPPPSPVGKASDCPPNSTHRGGLCRNADGHVVPIPPQRPPFS